MRKLLWEFGAGIEITYVMGGLARELSGDLGWLVTAWLNAAERSGMPFDPRAWNGPGALRSTFPACMAVKAAAEQGPEAAERYLRAVREGIMCRRRRLDRAEPLVEEAREAGLDAERFRVDVGSHAIVEAFGADLEETRVVPDAARERGLVREATHGTKGERLAFPTLHLLPADEGEEGWCGGEEPYERWRVAALRAGARHEQPPAPGVVEALRRFGCMAAVEVEAVCDLPGPRANAELWRLATEWRVRPISFLTGELWELA